MSNLAYYMLFLWKFILVIPGQINATYCGSSRTEWVLTSAESKTSSNGRRSHQNCGRKLSLLKNRQKFFSQYFLLFQTWELNSSVIDFRFNEINKILYEKFSLFSICFRHVTCINHWYFIRKKKLIFVDFNV